VEPSLRVKRDGVIFEKTAIYPMITGATAPPIIAMISNEEASMVFVPASLNANEKIVGNMKHSPRYRAKVSFRRAELHQKPCQS
jgi:hypothetical protein